MRKLIVAIALLLGVIYLITQMAEMQAIVETLRRGDWRFLLLALFVEAAWLLNVALVYRSVYRALGMEERLGRLVLLAAAANFLNVIAPSAGLGGVAMFISDARRHGYKPGRVTVAGVLFVLFDYVGFLFVLALGLIVLIRRNNLNPAELIATAVLLLIASVLASLLFLGMRSADALGRTLAWMARQVNLLVRPLLRRNYLSEARAHTFAHELSDGLRQLDGKPVSLATPAALALSSKALLICVLFLMFLAFKVPFTPGTLVAGFSIGYLFMVVSPTPAGIGMVEGALTLALRSLNVPLGAAAVVALAYRGITFWIPLFVGMAAFRWLSHHSPIEPKG